MGSDDDQFMDEDFEVRVSAEKVKSSEDFLRFLSILKKGVLEDDEVDKRLQLEFMHVIARKLNFAASLPNHQNLTIEMPEQPDWNWLARLFFVGAFEN